MTNMTFAERCKLSEQCLPDAPYRAMLTKLHQEMLQEINRLQSPQAMPATENGGKTGWPPGMLQDDSRELSKWLASKPDARKNVREAMEDAIKGGVGIMKDGKRIDPASIYAEPKIGCVNHDCDQCKAVQEPVSEDRSRVLFERHWRKTRGPKKSDRELTRHRLQPQTYIQDSANRHWVTWQAALKTALPAAEPAHVQEPIGYFTVNDYDMWEQIDGTSGKPLYERPAAQKPWVGLTDEELQDLMAIYSGVVLYRAIEDTLRERNT
jgi:hypothetical protein